MSGTDPAAGAGLGSLPADIAATLPRVLAASDFLAESLTRNPQLLAALLACGDLTRRLASGELAARAPELSAAVAEGEAQSVLRRWRRHELVRIAWRDLAGWADLEETLADLTEFADTAIRTALGFARHGLVARYGEPRSASGEIQPLVVIGMGKLGGGELNFSSDVDLVLLFPEHGETDGRRGVANEEFFTRLVQALVRLLEAPTAEGFVLRVDLRLRPFGDSGPVVASFASFEDYLPRHGRDWERYAYIKARAITAAERYAEIEASAVRPFVYRRYLDYGVFESLREMKALIAREVERRELADDVKLGPGGIREIEFIVQALQLTRGGRDRGLQTPALRAALARLGETRILPAQVVAELEAAYVYLRRLENRLQMLGDAQVHALPLEPAARERIALAMGARDSPALLAELGRHRERVRGHFREVILGGGTEQDAAVRIDLGRFWDSRAETAALAESLEHAGFLESAEAARLLLELRASSLVRKLDEPGRRRLQALLPVLLADVARSSAQLPVLRRILTIIEATGKRSAYFALLRENAAARSRLVELVGHGEFLAAQIAAQPLLLDELIDARLLSQLPTRASLAAELTQRLGQLGGEDPERQVEALRHFQSAAVFRVAVADLTGAMPLMQVSDRLTDIAELIIERALELALAADHRAVRRTDVRRWPRTVNICAVGYGKLGGMELGYSSDLDLVFLHDSHGERQETSATSPDRQPAVLRAPGAAHRAPAHHAFGRRTALRGRRAAAPERQGGAAGHEHRGVRRVPAARGVDLGAPGTAARPQRRRLADAAGQVRACAARSAVPPRAPRGPAQRGARHARAHAPRAREGG